MPNEPPIIKVIELEIFVDILFIFWENSSEVNCLPFKSRQIT